MIFRTSVAILSVTLFAGGVTPKLAAQSAQGQSPGSQAAPAQGPPTQRLSATTERQEFEVASIRQNKSDAQPYANFSIGPGTMYNPTAGVLSTINIPLVVYTNGTRISSDQLEAAAKNMSWQGNR